MLRQDKNNNEILIAHSKNNGLNTRLMDGLTIPFHMNNVHSDTVFDTVLFTFYVNAGWRARSHVIKLADTAAVFYFVNNGITYNVLVIFFLVILVTFEKSIHACIQIVISCDTHLLLLLFTSALSYSIDGDVSFVFLVCVKSRIVTARY